MTDGQLASLSWCHAPTWDPRPDFYNCQTVVCLLRSDVFSDMKAGLLFTAAGAHQCSYIYRLRPLVAILFHEF
jgi:hypothetical protein